ncbi:hydantoinase B/oxoprolinase family protein [Dactylosporangium sp. NPDC051484]|uniref:hydantoinase B/oxoprolinase family protein n=1 Tax=Dactylosporangium sp. NPDC051484 TaxID=3154942 RepID=UPI00344D593D
MSGSTTSGPDAVTLGLVRGVLASAVAEIETLIERTSMSPFINEKKDYDAGYTDASGRALLLRNPVGANKVEALLDIYPAETMQHGDIYWYNDCYASQGGVTHSPDLVFISPAFAGDTLVGFCEVFGHFWDIGGMRPGSLSPDATEIFQEGIIVPPVRVFRDGQWNEDLIRLFIRNSRFPEMLEGDIRAMTAAVQMGVTRLVEAAERFGAQTLRQAMDTFLSQTTEALRARVREVLPQGTLRFAEPIETSSADGPHWIRLEVQRDGDSVRLDLTESSDQSLGPANFLMHTSVPPLALAQSVLPQDSSIVFNGGAADIADVVQLREGSIVQPRFPAALGSRGSAWQRFASAIQGVLAQATEGDSTAASANYCLYMLRSFDPATGRWLLVTDGMASGRGARPYADGSDAIYHVGQKNYPIEYIEMSYPVRLEEYSIHPDSGGPGLHRGGCGVVREFTFLRPAGQIAIRIDNVQFPPWGVSGGMSGRSGSITINPGTPQARELAPMSDGNAVEEGDVIRILTSGGGGWGDPFLRTPDLVREDVLGGFVSVEGARRDYGVVLDPQTFDIDIALTKELRSGERSHKLFHRDGYVDEIW